MADVRRLDALDDAPRDDGTLTDGLLDGLLSDVVPEPPGPLDAVSAALEAHREHARAWYGDLIGPLVVPAVAAVQFVDALRSSDHALRAVMSGPFREDTPPSADGDETLLRAARAQFLDDDRLELTGIEISLPPGPAPAERAEAGLDGLDASSAAWLRIPADPDWIEALDVIADDGAERVALVLPTPSVDAGQRVASMIQALASRRLPFSLSAAADAAPAELVTGPAAYGLLNLLCVVGAAAEAAQVSESSAIAGNAARLAHLTDLLAQTDAGTVIEEARRISPASAGAIRGLLDRIVCGSVRALVTELESAALIVPDVA